MFFINVMGKKFWHISQILYYRTPAEWTGVWLFQSGEEGSFFNVFELVSCCYPVSVLISLVCYLAMTSSSNSLLPNLLGMFPSAPVWKKKSKHCKIQGVRPCVLRLVPLGPAAWHRWCSVGWLVTCRLLWPVASVGIFTQVWGSTSVPGAGRAP